MDRRRYMQALGGTPALGVGSGIEHAQIDWLWDTFWGSGPTVDTESGTVEGETIGNTDVFKGIPYAEQPTGELRWRPPQTPAPSWDGTRDATEYGDMAAQSSIPGYALEWTSVDYDHTRGSEECLNLNVWTPSDAGPDDTRPVMFWIHGGGFTVGSNRYDSQMLSEVGDVVVVTINYRLGPLGLFTHPDLLAEDERNVNQAIQDQVAALEWVQRNIREFGGDPDNVTIFGESAGGMSVFTLMADPSNEGLFHRAISQSGPMAIPFMTREEAAQAGAEMAEKMGCTGGNSLDCLREASTHDVFGATEDPIVTAISRFRGYETAKSLLKGEIGPVIDGTVIEKHPAFRFRDGEFVDVPLICGTNADETQLFLMTTPVPWSWHYQNIVRDVKPEHADALLDQYPADQYERPKDALIDLSTDGFFENSDRLLAGLIEENGGTVYRYLFDDAPSRPMRLIPLFEPEARAYHAAEMAYIFGGDVTQRGFRFSGVEERDQWLVDQMQDYWTSFAHTGDPNSGDAPEWPAFTAANQEMVRLKETAVETETGLPSHTELWWDIYRDEMEAQYGETFESPA